tara:strand:- start:1249 stop:2082 length:834 start_codon:yes stop_codon:yes gene_type:complete
MQIFKKISQIREILSDLEKNNSKINLIPTMGNIHEGHLSLLEEANKFEGTNIVSVFINPTQFNDIKDFENYPNTFDHDLNLLSKNNCEIIFAPDVNEMYPNGLETKKTIFKYRDILCDTFRPGHFDGVTTVVKMLLDIIKPSKVFFGEKDFQQLKIIETLIIKNKIKTNLIKCSSIRSANGMSLSSRYTKFSKEEKTQFENCAKIINKNLIDLIKSFDTEIFFNIKKDLQTIGISKIDYCEVREENNLEISNTIVGSRLFIAFYVNQIRVIDNFILY